jgi:hypothetical protein
MLVLTSCSGTPSLSGEEGATVNAPRGSTNLIGRDELDAYPGQSARQVVERLRPSWLRASRGVTLGAGRVFAQVLVDGALRGDLDQLASLNAADVGEMRYLSPADATNRYGTGFMGGAIEVRTRR